MLPSPPGLRAKKWNAALHLWAADKRGAAAVEFALIAIPFFFLLFGLLELALIFVMGTVLEHAVHEAGRQIRTGQFQTATSSQTDEVRFKQMICDRLMDLMSCDARLMIDVKSFSSFGASTNAVSFKSNGELDTDAFDVSPGAADEIVVVRAYYSWGLITPIMSKPLENLPNGRHLLSAVAVFRNEPF